MTRIAVAVSGALLIDETGDAATPFEGSLVARRSVLRFRTPAGTGASRHRRRGPTLLKRTNLGHRLTALRGAERIRL
jgi:hypothetical protein